MGGYRKSAVTFLAALTLVVAAACGSSSATTAPNGPSGSQAPGASTAVNPNDPNSIIDAALSGGSTAKSFHIKLEIAGTIKKEALASAGDTGLPITSDVKLDGTTLEGDVDVAGGGVNLTFNVPPMQMLGNQPLTGGLIVKDQVLYYKVSILGAKYTKMDLGSLAGSLPLPSLSPAADATAGLASQLEELKAQMDAAGVKATLVGVEQIGGKDANHINVSIPLDKVNAAIAAEASSGPAMTIDSAGLDFWVYKDNNQLAKFELKGSSATIGNLDIVVTITNYDAPVSIAAPPASEVNAAG